jgi:hypothetical protein
MRGKSKPFQNGDIAAEDSKGSVGKFKPLAFEGE